MTITLGSLFDGIGVFPLAASRHGIIPAWAIEIVFTVRLDEVRIKRQRNSKFQPLYDAR